DARTNSLRCARDDGRFALQFQHCFVLLPLRHGRRATVTMAKRISSSKMQGRADVRPIQNLTEPMHLFGRLKKWVFPINGCVLPIRDIIDYSTRIGCRIPDLPNMQRNELQVMRIDVAGIEEALSFLGTTARIVRV